MRSSNKEIRCIDLFCGIGGFRIAADSAFSKYGIDTKWVFSSDIDKHAQKAYKANFGELPFGDIRQIEASEIPDHDILYAGFPCQSFSIIGEGKGFADTRGTLFFEIERILDAKKPKAFVLENVKQLVGHNGGRTFATIIGALNNLGYTTTHRILNALDFGLPQKRERVFIVGFLGPMLFTWPEGGTPMKPLSEILEANVPDKHYASEHIRKKRLAAHTPECSPSIWHENKSGNISSYPYACALRANASYNYLLVDGIRRLTPREMLRLQGFPDWFKLVCSDAQTRKQAGNSLPVPIVEAILEAFIPTLHNGAIRESEKEMETTPLAMHLENS